MPFEHVLPAAPGYFTKLDDYSSWAVVIAWGFHSADSQPLPISLWGGPSTNNDHFWIRTPTGEELRMDFWS